MGIYHGTSWDTNRINKKQQRKFAKQAFQLERNMEKASAYSILSLNA